MLEINDPPTIVINKKYNVILSGTLTTVIPELLNPLKTLNKISAIFNSLTVIININENIKNMVIGHTPQFYANKMGLNSTCDNKIWRIDTGSSLAFNILGDASKESRKIQILEILNDGEKVNILKDIS